MLCWLDGLRVPVLHRLKTRTYETDKVLRHFICMSMNIALKHPNVSLAAPTHVTCMLRALKFGVLV